MSKIIGVDVDGVLANFFKAYEDLIIDVSGVDKFGDSRYPHVFPRVWNWPESYGYNKETMNQVWDEIKFSESFWLNMEPLPGAEGFLNKLSQTDHEVYFITDRPGIETQLQTTAWLEEHGYPLPSVIISRKGKGAVCDALSINYYIDDKVENIEDVNWKSAHTKAFLLYYPYNNHFEYPFRINSLVSFMEALGQ